MKNLPYLALYTKDFKSNSHLRSCSAKAIGIYIYLMCEMHESPIYGCLEIPEIKLRKTRARHEQDMSEAEARHEQGISKAATYLSKIYSFPYQTIYHALNELIENEVIYLDNNMLCQKRMIRDAKKSEILSESATKGNKSRYLRKSKKQKNEDEYNVEKSDIKETEKYENIKAKKQEENTEKNLASLEYEYAIENENEINSKERESREGGTTESSCVLRHKTGKPSKVSFGENVSLTEEEHSKLCEKFGSEQTRKMIDILDNYKGANGKNYKSDYRAILNWVVDRYEKDTKYQQYANRSNQQSLRAAQSDEEFKQFIYNTLNADN